jgi:hypothetical protein
MTATLKRMLTCLLSISLMTLSAYARQTPKQDSNATVTIVTAGDISVTRAADGKAAVVINFAPGKSKAAETRITITGAYSLDVNGGVIEDKTPQGIELHVLSHEELRFEAPEVVAWEQSHKYTQYTACSKIPTYPACGNPVCDQYGHPGDQCRYNTSTGCACLSPTGGPCSSAANSPTDKK